MSANYRNPNFLLPNEVNMATNPDLSVDRHSLYSMEFDGTQYISIPATTTGTLNTRSVSFWFKTSTISSFKGLMKFDTTNGKGCIKVFTHSSKIQVNGVGNDGVTNAYQVMTSTLSNDTWYHICIVSSPNTPEGKIYVNSVEDTNTGGAGTSADVDSFSYIGKLKVNSRAFNGQIDEVAIWSSDQTSNISNIYNGGSPGNVMALPNKPYAYYPLGEQARNTGYLSSGSDVSGSEWQFPNQSIQSTAVNFAAQDYIQYPHISLPGAFTVSTWAKTTDTSTYGNLLSNSNQWGGGGNLNRNWVLTRWNRTARFIAYNSSGTVIFNNDLGATGQGVNTGPSSSDPSLYNGQWNHILAIWDGTTNTGGIKVFINGVLEGLGTASTTAINTDSSVPITAGSSDSNFDYIGEQSNQKIWNTALSYGSASTKGDLAGGEVAALYNGGSPYTGTQPQLSNLKAWYKLNAANSSYAPYNANFNNALNFVDTPGDKVEITSPSSSMQPTTTLTLSFWANFQQDANWMLSNGGWGQASSGNNGYSIQTFAGRSLRFYLGDGTTSGYFGTNSGVFELNKWHHIVITYENGTAIIYIDRNIVTWLTSPSINSIAYSASYNPFFGSVNSGGAGANAYDGLLSNVAVFNTTLDLTAVSTLYNNGTPETSISHSPVSWWKLDAGGTTITDYGSGGNNGTNNGATLVSSPVAVEQWVFTDSAGSNDGSSTTLPTSALVRSDLQFESPYSNFSLDFDGTGDYIDCTDISYFSGADRFTLSTWFKVDSSDDGSANRDIISKGTTSSGTTSFLLRKQKNSNGNKVQVAFDEGATNFYSTTQIQNDIWYHVIIVYKGYESNNADRLNIYVDGVDVTASYTNTVPTTLVSSTQPLRIARWAGSATDFNGYIDETAIWETALTTAQVNQIYNNSLASDLTSLSPASWWRLGEDAYFVNNNITIPNQIAGGPSGTGSGTQTSMLVADAPGSYGSGSGVNLDIVDRIGEAPGTSPINVANSQSYNMIPDDRHPYVPGYVPAQVNNVASMSLDGVNDYFQVSSGTSFDFGSNDFSFSGWFTRGNTAVGNDVLFFSRKSTDIPNWQIRQNVKNIQIEFNVGEFNVWSDVKTTTNPIAMDTNWHHLAITKSGTSASIYIDGISQATSGTAPGTIDAGDGTAFIGSRNGTTQEWFGDIDEVAIFNYALTPKQIKEDIYNASTTGKTADLNNNSNLTAPVAWYRMGD